MNEAFLSFVWQYQYFTSAGLTVSTGERLQVLRVGYLNTNAGPDFTEARILLDNVEWAGSVEIHVKSSDWDLHQHTPDPSYGSVVLHVVWEEDRTVLRQDGTPLPTLVLSDKVNPALQQRYLRLMKEPSSIPCAAQFGAVPQLPKIAMLDRVLLERLETKARMVTELWEHNQRDWEETAYQWLAQHFGFKLNAPAFLRLAQSVPLKALQKHRSSLLQIEAMLFGTAGLLPAATQDPYILNLQKEYDFLAAKYDLRSHQMSAHEWKFFRLRPAGFPTVRLAQWAVVLQQVSGLFSTLTTLEKVEELQRLLRVSQSPYWKNHFHFGKDTPTLVPDLGKDAADLLVMNAAVPLLVAYSRQRDLPPLLHRALDWLEQLPAENNKITRIWHSLGMQVSTASDSQALLEWYTAYCSQKRCLECRVGMDLLRSS
jgi:hypothetical protein